MEALIKPFYEVMCKYEKFFSEQGVRANLTKWHENKGNLIALLRNHPDWNEDAMAIIFQLVESRDINRQLVDQHRASLLTLARGLARDQLNDFTAALMAATDEYSATPSEGSIEIIKERSGIKCVTGQKTSRIINRLCQKYGIDRLNEYNTVFTPLSDSLNPREIHKKAVLSVHPCDYLEMSNKDNTWTSCHNLRNGAYQSGCLSYLNDSVSMIFYTIDNQVSNNYSKALKRNRQVFCYGDGILLQSRLYPNVSDQDAIKQYRGLVQTAIAVCLDMPNRWTLTKNRNDAPRLFQTAEGSRHYQDYTYDAYRTLSTLKGMEIQGQLSIGGRAYCVCCGSALNRGEIKCGCTNKVVCQDCGKTVMAGSARYIEGTWLCNSCLRICSACGTSMRDGNLFPAFDGRGNIIHICEDCYQHTIIPCQECAMRSVCSAIVGNRFCQRAAATARRAAAA